MMQGGGPACKSSPDIRRPAMPLVQLGSLRDVSTTTSPPWIHASPGTPTLMCSMPCGGGGSPKLGMSGSVNSLGYTSILPATMEMAAVQRGQGETG